MSKTTKEEWDRVVDRLSRVLFNKVLFDWSLFSTYFFPCHFISSTVSVTLSLRPLLHSLFNAYLPVLAVVSLPVPAALPVLVAAVTFVLDCL